MLLQWQSNTWILDHVGSEPYNNQREWYGFYLGWVKIPKGPLFNGGI